MAGKRKTEKTSGNGVTNDNRITSLAILQNLVEKILIGVVITTPEGRTLYRNRASAEMRGFDSPEDAAKNSPTAATSYYDLKDRERFLELLSKGPVTDFEVRFRRKDGTPFWAALNARFDKDDSGNTVIITVSQDIDERKRMEELVAQRTAELQKQSEIVSRQAQEILEISTPVIQLWKGVLVTPLIGTLDSERTQRFMERLLQRIVDTDSETVLIDITGVPAIDTATAQHLIDTITAVKLLGAQVILTGVRPAIAQTLIHLGIDLTGLRTSSSLAVGLQMAINPSRTTVKDNTDVTKEK